MSLAPPAALADTVEPAAQERAPADSIGAIAACLALAVAGFATFMGMPLLVGAVIDQFGYSEGQGGYVASIEYLGMFIASAIVSLLILRCNRRGLALAGIATAIAGNAACLLVTALPALLALRFVSGLGCGTAYAVSVAVLAGTRHRVRNFSLLIFSQVFTNAVVVYAFPALIATWHVAAIFLSYCAMLAAAGLFIPLLPPRQAATPQAAVRTHAGLDRVRRLAPWICLAGVFCFYLMIGAYWAYIERIGVAVGLDEAFVGKAIAAGILLSLIACNAAYHFGRRWGQSRPLLFALAAVALTHLVTGLALGSVAFLVGLAVVNCFWNFTDIYQLGTIAHLDPSGVFASRIQGAQMLAMTVSPALAGWLLDHGLSHARLLVLLGGYVALAFAAYAAVYALLRHHAPELAEAREAGSAHTAPSRS
jgi:predicted MFS family arabinose efflux permease